MSRVLKRGAVIFLALFLLFGGTALAFPLVSVNTYSVKEGDIFSADILISGVEAGTQIAGFEFDLDFDPAILNSLSVVSGGYLPTLIMPPLVIEQDILAPDVNFSETVVGLGGGTGDGVLASISFEALAIGGSPLILNDVQLSAPFGVPVDFSVESGNATVSPVPVPGSLFLLGSGLLGLLGYGRKTRATRK